MASAQLSSLGIVVIGRNEAPRLPACLAALPASVPALYVDSASHDGSPELARAAGVPVLALAAEPGMCAARARNAGFEALMAAHPALTAIFFIDGDCVLRPGFLDAAVDTLRHRPDCAIIVGPVEETNAQGNVYGLLAALEWSSSHAGEITDFGQLGGIMLVRAEDFRAIGGFDGAFIAGEDSELGIRLHLAGRKTWRIATPMVAHAMEMTSFGQWWRRSVRAGQALAQRYMAHGRSALADSRSAFFSTLAYGLAVPLAALAGLALFGAAGLIPMAAYAFLFWRFFRHYRGKGAEAGAAATGAGFGVLAKLANMAGLARFFVQRARGGYSMIDYKGKAAAR